MQRGIIGVVSGLASTVLQIAIGGPVARFGVVGGCRVPGCARRRLAGHVWPAAPSNVHEERAELAGYSQTCDDVINQVGDRDLFLFPP
uniref:Uncharacterized protein n=1 Tax=uncultured prokaryote TaxID=198431 RepID=A0A0H5Q7K0_9ZZZZ|nr:hypothetical protein [uncultured prokaryote]